MATKPIVMADIAVQYAEEGFKVYPTIPGKKIPHARSNGENDATDNPEEVKALFAKYNVNSNIAINLKGTDLIVIDADEHVKGKSGHASLERLAVAYEPLPPTYTIRTPSGGTHYYYRTPGISLNQDLQDLLPGVDVMASKIMAVPSRSINNNGELVGRYTEQSGKITEITNIPKWFLDYLKNNYQQKQSSFTLDYKATYNAAPQGKKYTAMFMEELLSGQDDGNRNVWLTKQFGRMIALGMDFTAAYEWIKLVNQNFVRPPLSAKKLNAIVASITKREQQKYGKVGD